MQSGSILMETSKKRKRLITPGHYTYKYMYLNYLETKPQVISYSPSITYIYDECLLDHLPSLCQRNVIDSQQAHFLSTRVFRYNKTVHEDNPTRCFIVHKVCNKCNIQSETKERFQIPVFPMQYTLNIRQCLVYI